ncbi:MAG: hybrid sensor histidine kinase/response regulator [Nitrospinae bacterium]|jgi:two-component system, sensor histidine kinase and response regulator|nr:hybrid sensor histidine kinase/response regulator [Nitrospinota bacterium]MDA1109174.1 hybrid sensor histidine kinase/response regulator [Nitrospinota bacterium]
MTQQTELKTSLLRNKVLIVDDTPANIDVLRKTLAPEGYELSVATSGEAAVKIAARLKPDLILLDIMMPGIDGYETCRRIKSDVNNRDTAIIFISAKNETADVVKGFSMGAVDYINKPFQHEEVCSRVRTQVNLRALTEMRESLLSRLKDSVNKLTEMDEMKNRFLGMAAHDLRNPLVSIRGLSELLLDENNTFSDGDVKEFIATMHDASQYMLSLVNDLLDTSVIASGNLTINLKKCSLKELVEKVVRANERLAENKQMKIQLSLEDVPEFNIDPNRITQVVENLLTNAIKYSSPGSNIYVSLESVDDSAKVGVRDEGPGISLEDQKKLFGGFQKLTAQPTGGESSTGLGLAIVKKMVEAHQGTLDIESQMEVGTTFSFKISKNLR